MTKCIICRREADIQSLNSGWIEAVFAGQYMCPECQEITITEQEELEMYDIWE